MPVEVVWMLTVRKECPPDLILMRSRPADRWALKRDGICKKPSARVRIPTASRRPPQALPAVSPLEMALRGQRQTLQVESKIAARRRVWKMRRV